MSAARWPWAVGGGPCRGPGGRRAEAGVSGRGGGGGGRRRGAGSRPATDTGVLRVPTRAVSTATNFRGRWGERRVRAGLSARRYPVGLEPVGEQVTATAS